MLNFRSYKRFYLLSLYVNFNVTGKLKPHTKQSAGAHISTTTWLWEISMWSLYYDHILAAGKLGSIDSNKT